MTRNEFLKMAGTSAALVVINTALVPTAIAAEPIGTVLSAKKSVNTGTAVSSATFELVPISRQTFWGVLVHAHSIICLKDISNGRLPSPAQ